MNEEATLIVNTVSKGSNGFPVKSQKEIPIWVKEKSATRTEFYDAYRAGITVKTVFETRQEDFDLSAHTEDGRKEYATQIKYDGNLYDIVRTYRKDKASIEIVCS